MKNSSNFDHLGNVHIVLSDIKISTTVNDTLAPFKADVMAAYSHYPFGLIQPDMYSEAGTTYRFGFNGMMRDDDVKDLTTTSPTPNEGVGNSYDFGARMYDPRVTRFFSLDPMRVSFPWQSPYLYAGDNPIKYIDYAGAFKMDPDDERNYPQLATLLRLSSDKIINNEGIINSLIKWSGASMEEVKNGLVWGEGPTVKVTNLGQIVDNNGNVPVSALWGMVVNNIIGTKDEGNLRRNLVDKNNVLQINSNLVRKLSEKTNNVNQNSIIQFGILATILHEYTHVLDTYDGLDESQFHLGKYREDVQIFGFEAGDLFESDALGRRKRSNGTNNFYDLFNTQFKKNKDNESKLVNPTIFSTPIITPSPIQKN